MQPRSRQTILAIPIILGIAGAVAWLGGQGSANAFGWPLFGLCAALSFGINWLVFIPAYLYQTERYFDLTGSLTFLGLVAFSLWFGPADARSLLLGALVAVWAMRLGPFLFLRIRAEGGDGRFDRIKPDFSRFLLTWTLQGLWVFLTLSCALAAMTANRAPEAASPDLFDLLTALGLGVWILGFAIEVVADAQKRRFRRDPANRGGFITTGLWAWSQHPNYFGEITLWSGIALIAVAALSGGSWVTLISPVFVFVLLTRISGIPLLDAKAKRQWHGDPAHAAYLARTPSLVPRPPRSAPPAGRPT